MEEKVIAVAQLKIIDNGDGENFDVAVCGDADDILTMYSYGICSALKDWCVETGLKQEVGADVLDKQCEFIRQLWKDRYAEELEGKDDE